MFEHTAFGSEQGPFHFEKSDCWFYYCPCRLTGTVSEFDHCPCRLTGTVSEFDHCPCRLTGTVSEFDHCPCRLTGTVSEFDRCPCRLTGTVSEFGHCPCRLTGRVSEFDHCPCRLTGTGFWFDRCPCRLTGRDFWSDRCPCRLTGRGFWFLSMPSRPAGTRPGPSGRDECRALARVGGSPTASARPGRFELPTPGSVDQCSIQLSYGRSPLRGPGRYSGLTSCQRLITPRDFGLPGGPEHTSQDFHTRGDTTTAMPVPARFPPWAPCRNPRDIGGLARMAASDLSRHEHCSSRRSLGWPWAAVPRRFSPAGLGLDSPFLTTPSRRWLRFTKNASHPFLASHFASPLSSSSLRLDASPVDLVGSADLQWRAPRFPRGRATAFL